MGKGEVAKREQTGGIRTERPVLTYPGRRERRKKRILEKP